MTRSRVFVSGRFYALATLRFGAWYLPLTILVVLLYRFQVAGGWIFVGLAPGAAVGVIVINDANNLAKRHPDMPWIPPRMKGGLKQLRHAIASFARKYLTSWLYYAGLTISFVYAVCLGYNLVAESMGFISHPLYRTLYYWAIPVAVGAGGLVALLKTIDKHIARVPRLMAPWRLNLRVVVTLVVLHAVATFVSLYWTMTEYLMPGYLISGLLLAPWAGWAYYRLFMETDDYLPAYFVGVFGFMLGMGLYPLLLIGLFAGGGEINKLGQKGKKFVHAAATWMKTTLKPYRLRDITWKKQVAPAKV